MATRSRHKTAAIAINVHPELKRAAELTAADDQRSLTSLIEKLLTVAARDAGHLPQTRTSRKKAAARP